MYNIKEELQPILCFPMWWFMCIIEFVKLCELNFLGKKKNQMRPQVFISFESWGPWFHKQTQRKRGEPNQDEPGQHIRGSCGHIQETV